MTARAQLQNLLESPDFLTMPCCFDALSAKLIEQAGFPLTFMSGFGVAAARLARPDTGLISFGEILDQGRSILEAVSIPVIGDGDTGYGNVANVRRTVESYARAGFSCIMIEDQVAPKRCGHTRGKEVIEREDALKRLKAAIDARNEGADILIMARTDARATRGLEEALSRMEAFSALGADILFMEAPHSIDEMAFFCSRIQGHKMANMLENGDTPLLPPRDLEALGYKIAAYPLTLLSASVKAMQTALSEIQSGSPASGLLPFQTLQKILGFPEYDNLLEKY
jgi:2-methylisocitrate lyase-like PEP mutase family enzyme